MASLFHNVRLRIIIMSAIWIPILAGFIWRIYAVQIKRHDELSEKARIKYSTKVKLTGKRGEIFDFDGNLLVTNIPKVTIALSPHAAVYEAFLHYEKHRDEERRKQAPALREQRRKKLAQLLSGFFGKPFEYYYENLNPFIARRSKNGKLRVVRNNYFLLAREAEPEQAKALRQLIRQNKLGRSLATFSFRDIYVRSHSKGRLLADVLGYTNIKDERDVPQGGLEKALDKSMKSTDGVHSYERGRKGGVLSYGKQHLLEASDGKDIFLTIRENVQSILEEELDLAWQQWNPTNIYAAIADPRTGDILALAQRPTWDPTDRSTFISGRTGTRFAGETYEPGSVFKPFFVGKALDWNVVSPADTIDCENGSWNYAGRPLNDVGRYGLLSVGDVLKKSSNVGAAKIGLMLGDKRMNEVRTLFGFGQRTGLPFGNEARGRMLILPKEKVASTRVPIGYTTNVTILQLLRGYCAIATGRLPKLNIIDRERDPETGIETVHPRQQPVPVFENPEAHKHLVDMLCTVTARDGTGKRAAIKGYEVAGKTGTARKHFPGRGYVNKAYYTSFAGFVPARHPELVMVVTVDHPRGSNLGGGTVAAPIFQRTMERVLRMLIIPPDFPE